MIKLTDEQKDFVRKTIKPLLKGNKLAEAIEALRRADGGQNILAWLAESGVDIFIHTKTIPANLFNGSELSKIKIPDNVRAIGEYAFANCPRLLQVQLGAGITDIDDGAFSNSSIAKIILPPSLESLGKGVFQGCKNLQEVYVPDSLIIIPANTFDGCYDDVIIYMNSRKDMPRRFALQIPRAEAEWYKAHTKVKEA